jgi:hypothetical protein
MWLGAHLPSLHLGLCSQANLMLSTFISNQVHLGAICKLSSCDDIDSLLKPVM